MINDKNTQASIPSIESGDEIFEPGSASLVQMSDSEPTTKPPGSRDARQQAKNKNKGHTDTDNYRK